MELTQENIYRYMEYCGDELDENEMAKIIRVSKDEGRNGSKGVIADELLDILLWLNNKPTRAEAFAELICLKVPIGSRILEVGCGPRATMAHKLVKKGMQVTAIDPRLKEPSASFKKEYFTLDYDISSYDIVVGLEPCEAAELIIRACVRENKPFIMAPCGQPHERLNGQLDDNCLVWWDYLRNIHPGIELKYVSMIGGYVIPMMSLFI
ncbi:hypothetical protein J6W91_02380 [Candidatus Saccharibacteria bacterium]|nr:hypothetical protein [Candidatus Saccharibacteria bacterium]